MKKSELVANYCKRYLSLNNAVLGDEYYYQSLPLYIIDAVFSIGVKYDKLRVCHLYIYDTILKY